jgi:putative oxidoreductase
VLKSCTRWLAGPTGGCLRDFGLLALRLWLGLSMLILHGWGKFQGFAEASKSFPDPLGVGSPVSLALAVFAEVVCAALLALGLATRLALILLIITMGVAFFVVHGGALTGDRSGELAFIYLGGFVTLLLTGPGRFSVDRSICGGGR